MRKSLLTAGVLIVFLAVVFSVGMVLMLTPKASAQQTLAKWEYLSFEYNQLNPYDEFGNSIFDQKYEFVEVTNPAYQAGFATDVFGDCDRPEASELGMLFSIMFSPEIQSCLVGNFKGRIHFMDRLGQDGWELISTEHSSSETTYTATMMFKRQTQ